MFSLEDYDYHSEISTTNIRYQDITLIIHFCALLLSDTP